jgi:hypothetical protein
MALSTITKPIGGYPHGINKVFKSKCFVYIAEGKFDDTEMPNTITALKALYTGSLAPFVPFGRMEANGSQIEWEEQSIAIDFGEIPTGVEVNGELKGITFSKEMLSFVDEKGLNEYSFLFVPDGKENIFAAVSGVNIKSKGKMNVVGDGLSGISWLLNRKGNNISDIVLFDELSA